MLDNFYLRKIFAYCIAKLNFIISTNYFNIYFNERTLIFILIQFINNLSESKLFVIINLKMSTSSFFAKFRGCLIGALVGDCLGAPFEGEERVSISSLCNYFQEWLKDGPKTKLLKYTDDTAATRAVASSLIDCRGFDPSDMAQKLAEEYHREPDRGYGSGAITLFEKLRDDNYKDPFGPAKELFGGSGSYGNGAAMRISPVALYLHQQPKQLVELSHRCALLTHAHTLGYTGAILHSLAVNRVLTLGITDQFDFTAFIGYLRTELDEINASKIWGEKLKTVEHLLSQNPQPSGPEVAQILGNGIAATESVPTALYCFLNSFRPLPDWQTDHGFERALFLAISLGGDTDTIASMACSLAGAFYGIDDIPSALRISCEGWEFSQNLADKLLSLAEEKGHSL